jgi:hypothetical protein
MTLTFGARGLSSFGTAPEHLSVGLSAYLAALLAMGAVALAGVLDCLRLPRDAGAQVSGHRT